MNKATIKQRLRMQLMANLPTLPWGKLSQEISLKLIKAMPQLSSPVGVFYSLPYEPDLSSFYKELRKSGQTLCLPCIQQDHLAFIPWLLNDTLEKGDGSIFHPAWGAAVLPQTVILPMLGFNAACYRLGRGKGHYDRTFALWQKNGHVFQTIGIAANSQKIEASFQESHDLPLDRIITEEHDYFPHLGRKP